MKVSLKHATLKRLIKFVIVVEPVFAESFINRVVKNTDDIINIIFRGTDTNQTVKPTLYFKTNCFLVLVPRSYSLIRTTAVHSIWNMILAKHLINQITD